MSLQFLMLPVIWGPSLHGGELFPLNGPQWSLFLELTINAAHAATIRWITPHRMIAITAASAGVLVWTSVKFGGLDVGWSRQTFWGGPPRVVYGFVVGLLIFRCRLMGVAAPRTPYALVVLALGACLFRPFAEILPNSLVDPMLVIVVLPTLVAFAVTASVPTAALPFVTILGALSYPLYAIHAPILRGFEAILDTLPDGEARLGWAIALPMVVVSGFAFERFFDAPIRGWLRRRTA
jgi:peptidoglycan/LPS O-acetylase OafA/YrhL